MRYNHPNNGDRTITLYNPGLLLDQGLHQFKIDSSNGDLFEEIELRLSKPSDYAEGNVHVRKSRNISIAVHSLSTNQSIESISDLNWIDLQLIDATGE